MIVGAEPRGETQRVLADAEMLVEPVARHRRRRHHAAEFVILPHHLVALAGFPRTRPEAFRPGVGVALALHADQDRGALVAMRLGVSARLVLADPQMETLRAHV